MMRKFFYILIVAAAFGLGLVSQNLFAGSSWVYASYGLCAPTLAPVKNYIMGGGEGMVLYDFPSQYKSKWQIASIGRDSGDAWIVSWKIRKGLTYDKCD